MERTLAGQARFGFLVDILGSYRYWRTGNSSRIPSGYPSNNTDRQGLRFFHLLERNVGARLLQRSPFRPTLEILRDVGSHSTRVTPLPQKWFCLHGCSSARGILWNSKETRHRRSGDPHTMSDIHRDLRCINTCAVSKACCPKSTFHERRC